MANFTPKDYSEGSQLTPDDMDRIENEVEEQENYDATQDAAIAGKVSSDTRTSDLAAQDARDDAQEAAVSTFARRVVLTASGATGAENGAGTWAKLATFDTDTNQYAECQLLLGIATCESGVPETAILSAYFRTNSTGQTPQVAVEILARSGDGIHITDDAFKMVSGGWSTDMELWMRKGAPYGRFAVYELARAIGNGELIYPATPAWQSAAPTGAVNNVTSAGVTGSARDVFESQLLSDPVDLDTIVTPGRYFIGGSFLNGDAPDPNTYHVPGNSGSMFLTVTATTIGANRVIFQQYASMDGANQGGQRRRWEGTWSAWMTYN